MDHTVTAYEEELRELSRDVGALGAMALQQLHAALQVIAGDDRRPADQIIAQDLQLNAAAQEIERKAIRLIALRQPMAGDLRRTVLHRGLAVGGSDGARMRSAGPTQAAADAAQVHCAARRQQGAHGARVADHERGPVWASTRAVSSSGRGAPLLRPSSRPARSR